MSSEVAEHALKSLCLLVVDCPHATPKWTESGVVVLRNQNIKGGRLDLSSPSFTDEEHYQGRVRRAVPQAGDIVMTREAPMGDVCQIPRGLRCCVGQRQVLLREYFSPSRAPSLHGAAMPARASTPMWRATAAAWVWPRSPSMAMC